MAQNGNAVCLHTTVKNTSGTERTFGYLGPRGKRLAAGESFTVRGDLVGTLGAMTSRRKFDGLTRSLDRGALAIVSSPAVFLYDETDERTRALAVAGGVLGTVDPCYDSTGSSEFIEDAGNP
jgi:hypothetical protein